MDDKQLEKVQKEINENVQNLCPYRFDDPQTKIKDSCGLFNCHCVAMDSVYSHAENNKSICQTYNNVMSKYKGRKIITENKFCERCNKSFIPKGNRQIYCEICSKLVRRDASRKAMQKNRINVNS
jgi:hypothetical protein